MQQKKKISLYHIYLIIGIAGFCTYEVVSKTVVGHINATQLTFVRFLVGGLVLLPFAIKELKGRGVRPSGRELLVTAFLGFMLVFISMNLVQYGINYTWASLAAVLFSSNPIFITVFSSLIRKEKITVSMLVGLAVGLIGVFVSVSNAFLVKTSSHTNLALGIGLILFSTVVFSLYTVLGKGLSIKLGSITQTSLTSLFGAVTLLPLMAVQHMNPFGFDLPAILPQLLYLAVFITGVAYFCYFTAIANLNTGLASMAFFVKPPVASIIAAIVLKETISPLLIVGTGLIIAGVLVARNPKQLQDAARALLKQRPQQNNDCP